VAVRDIDASLGIAGLNLAGKKFPLLTTFIISEIAI
jgi:hypothetical protein